MTTGYARRSLGRATLACALATAAGCCAGEVPRGATYPIARLVEPGDAGRQSFGLRKTRQGRPYLFGNIALCLDRTGAADVTGVRFENPSGDLKVEAWALRPFYRAMGSDGVGWGEPRSLRQRRLFTAVHTVTQVCRPGDSSRVEFAELVVQTSRPNRASASGSGFLVSYTSGPAQGVLRIPFGITLCAPSERLLPMCQSKT